MQALVISLHAKCQKLLLKRESKQKERLQERERESMKSNVIETEEKSVRCYDTSCYGGTVGRISTVHKNHNGEVHCDLTGPDTVQFGCQHFDGTCCFHLKDERTDLFLYGLFNHAVSAQTKLHRMVGYANNELEKQCERKRSWLMLGYRLKMIGDIVKP